MIENQQKTNKSSLLVSDKRINDVIEIDFIELFRRIVNIRKTLYKAAGIGLVIGLIVALSIPKQYTVEVTLSPEMNSSKGSNGLAGLAASFLGSSTTLGENMDALNIALSSDIISSTPFLLELLWMKIEIPNKKVSTTLGNYLDGQSAPWWNYIIGLPSTLIEGVKSLFCSEDEINDTDKMMQSPIGLTKEEADKISSLKKLVIASVEKKTGITYISVTLQEPRIAAVVADSVVHKLQEYIINYRTSKAKDDCIYLEKLYKDRQQEYYIAQQKYANYIDSNDHLVLQSVRAEQERLQNDMSIAFQVYSQVANQLQIARAKIQEEKPVFAVVEPAVIPHRSSSIGLRTYVLIFMFLAVVFTISWMLLGRRIWSTLKETKKMIE